MYIVFHSEKIDLLSYLTVRIYLEYNHLPGLDYFIADVIRDFYELPHSPGKFIYVDHDNFNNQVYLLGRGREKRIICQALMGFQRIFEVNEKMVFYDLSGYHDSRLSLAAFLHKVKLTRTSKYLLRRGIERQYRVIYQDIKHFYQRVEQT